MGTFYRFLLGVCVFGMLVGGCGVNTDSSARNSTDVADSDGTNTTDPDDTNTTDPDDTNTTDPNYDDIEPNEDQPNSDYDTRGAVLDPNACMITDTFKNTLLHSSFEPVRESDTTNGVSIGSEFPYNADITLTRVALFYPDIVSSLAGNSATIRENGYIFTYDLNWPANTNKTVYIRTPKVAANNGYFGCYRYVLDSVRASEIEFTKVYRLR
jgi:hypothetical protein